MGAAGEVGDALPEGSCLLPARHRVRGFHLEEWGATRFRLDTEGELVRLGGSGPDLAVSICASCPADLLAGVFPGQEGKSAAGLTPKGEVQR
jgi:hypothetical protein